MAKDILKDNDLSICVTYPDISSELHNLYSFYIPNICIYKSKYENTFKNYPDLNLENFPWLQEYSSDFNYKEIFNIVYSKFDDGFGHEIFRIFLLKKKDI